jgi:hypothetical protein
MNGKRMRAIWLALLMAVCLAGVVACAPAVTAGAAAPPATPDPAALFAKLATAATLDEAATQMAAAAGAAVDVIRVRMTTGSCIPCSGKVENPAQKDARGVPVSEVALPLPKGASIWMRIGDVTCFYYYDGGKLAPQSCRILPE